MARQRLTLTIRRDDHIGDPIGTIFLDPERETEEQTFARIQRYLGSSIAIRKAELTHDRVVVYVEARGMPDESRRLSDAAEALRTKGMRRNARELFKEALKLDPLNGQALMGMGRLMVERDQYEAALPILRLTMEIAGESVELLQLLADVSVALQRVAAAIGYLERALRLEPANPAVKRAMAALGRTPPGPATPPRRLEVVKSGRKAN